MDENLVGYLLKSLDADTEKEVEGYLRTDPEAPRKLELLRQALEPLEADRDEIVPPADLYFRTLRLVAENRSRPLRRAALGPGESLPVPHSWWRRADVLVAASLLIISSLLLLPLLARANRAAKQIQCQNNLRGMFAALMSYGDAHNGELPKVEEDAPRNFAGMFVPVLYQDGLLNGVSMRCPANGGSPLQPVSVQELAELYQNNRPKYEQLTREVAGCYAYALGYRSDGRLYGLRRGTGQDDITPIVADRPPFDRQDDPMLLQANSPNHGGLGQNVLYLGGNVRWAVDRKAGPNDKDIYLNKKCELKPGLNPLDVVLASSGVRVEPEAPPEH